MARCSKTPQAVFSTAVVSSRRHVVFTRQCHKAAQENDVSFAGHCLSAAATGSLVLQGSFYALHGLTTLHVLRCIYSFLQAPGISFPPRGVLHTMSRLKLHFLVFCHSLPPGLSHDCILEGTLCGSSSIKSTWIRSLFLLIGPCVRWSLSFSHSNRLLGDLSLLAISRLIMSAVFCKCLAHHFLFKR